MNSTLLIILICVVVAIVVIATTIGIVGNDFKKITPFVKDMIGHFEHYYTAHGQGSKKLHAVLNAVELECEKRHIPYRLIKNLVIKLIEKVVNDYNVIKKGG